MAANPWLLRQCTRFFCVGDAVLSHILQYRQQFIPYHRPMLDQCQRHAEIGQQRRNRIREWVGDIIRAGGYGHLPGTAPAVEHLLLAAAPFALVIGDAAFGRTGLAVRLPAAKGTTQVLAAGIARVGQEGNPALHATDQASFQSGIGLDGHPQTGVVSPHQVTGRVLVMAKSLAN